MSVSYPSLPPLAGLEPARLDWLSDDTGEHAPHSTQFDDVYFSRHDGRAETEHVFLAGNDLPRRLAAWRERRPFTIGETGFGTGLNMLCAWACFDAHAPAGARLHLVSTERYPLTRDDLARALAAWPDLARRAERLVSQWPEPVAGVHRLWLDERVTLDLHFGDATERLALLEGQVDAWFLDGFAPARNPEMWQDELFAAMAARSRPGATFATFTCAGVVKRGLAAAGFAWRKVPGFGRKREMLAGEIAAPPADTRRGQTPWFTPPAPRPPRRVAVIGAGIAGASTAAALARRGIEVTLIDRLDRAELGATHLQGALYVKLAVETNLQSRAYLAGLLHSRRWLAQLDPDQSLWRPSGVLQLALDEKERQRQARFLANHSLPESVVRGLDAEAASRAAGIRLEAPALDYPDAAWVRPLELCVRLAQTPGVSFRRGEVTALHGDAAGWSLTLADGERIDADQVVIAAAGEAARFAQTAALPLQPVRGQVSQLALPEGAPALGRVVCAGGYVPPPADGVLNFGATFAPGDTDRAEREADHAANLAELERGLPHFVAALREAGAALAPERLTGRVGVRAASPDKSPYAGPVPDAEAWREDYAVLAKDATRIPDAPGRHHAGLWISAAHGSRGMASAPLCAELIASRMCDEPLPLEWPLVDHLHPGRRVVRDIVRGG
ncbi:bifunctional tRNA (5-methylaminomethyl-2-thiouridine)(34)-methyltransferase MnmD/FAD-dependent 5-carboxymethylaminomethyl-2-thiouridine(34) oxidoreductase MnmC [Halomonas sp. MCCC 1A17488]|uniref:bifunctional tRNA (5-methylaminomethyl-2-thiouridine)(34)-methyltransferase MnmD/FAD-dependent 5-carboxymethylaminomethyl-2-thiouridine(34) oxidoreductase MnmC n=1 Tax=unclassified Halomonas TaxID=2609666 RepID=UPI0018D23BED|nr:MULTISPECIES: bifunctional tRNA (5-methylaminomethyl-2-thiouridine)(34)-methyltransferase MnmD/FAD-dependent 5-carboxymethylaminomethyl-2-thiouridine(34) oxidoreductase MnmC [unclassified Halomonas]MCE8016656.1 bifunctional tRNA (5-methylaminomethyl-2-thiouridine)(34)-methyltransferase MnmD/FAD-dependent 5-carboxymethylaminomethyl-2-thiouridine(34) oxidoreductase MnmC [Halomonas sp. MCCC 1A17488]MCG3239989.1 bifunctional tRNA (5-methylaminomethyl-2-thiouridine)(34)-methyltransferase MnmD/FAD-d